MSSKALAWPLERKHSWSESQGVTYEVLTSPLSAMFKPQSAGSGGKSKFHFQWNVPLFLCSLGLRKQYQAFGQVQAVPFPCQMRLSASSSRLCSAFFSSGALGSVNLLSWTSAISWQLNAFLLCRFQVQGHSDNIRYSGKWCPCFQQTNKSLISIHLRY